MKSVGIIPARYASSRFEGKALADILGRPMIQHVYERACKSKMLSQVIVATDDRRIYDTVKGFSGNVQMTGECATGTDRVSVVAEKLTCDVIVNIQGDEPLLEPQQIDMMLQPFIERPSVQVCTLKERIHTIEDFHNPNVVKVVTNLEGDALYFSRGSIPSTPANKQPIFNENALVYKHIGLYAFRKEQLLAFTSWKRTPYEIAEGLEQLRFLEHGVPIHVVETDIPLIGVDVPADLERVKQILEKGGPHF
ncbi:MAG: 3-deoxy-manno-octulosonate cytidylyltransferase [Candidatus Poribacteria bacterium]|nr:3-deoxy-manno-octulosonate cytidylyltransferase [Candidatus Poribacteria bacterium]